MIQCTLLLWLALILRVHGAGKDEYYFSYDHQGNDWPALCKNGCHQSPILIDSEKVIEVEGDPIVLYNYELARFNMSLTSHSVVLIPIIDHPKMRIGFTGGGLKGFYRLQNIHFHWPSEHIIDEKKTVLEMHLVHEKEKKSKEGKHSLAVIGLLYEMGGEDAGIERLIESIDSGVMKLDATGLIDEDLDEYYTYFGSLTTPPCSETVTWFILEETKTISIRQAIWFTKLKLKSGPLRQNNRAIQKLNNRQVFFVESSISDEENIGLVIKANFFIILFIQFLL